ncbi:MAG: hypothetical protein R3B70_15615 [Polyangiaceae bacterium]
MPAGRHRAWAVLITDIDSFDPDVTGLSATIQVVYLDDEGKRLSITRSTGGYTLAHYKARTTRVFDIDSDGDAELLMCDVIGIHSQVGPGFWAVQDLEDCAIFQVEEGEVVASSMVEGLAITDFRDGDGDGRPDVLTKTPLDGLEMDTTYCDLQECEASFTMELLAHGQPDGSFSLGDDGAATARQLCPKKPVEIFPAGDKGAKFGDGVQNLVCAVLWGAAPAALRAGVDDARATMCRAPKECPHFDAVDRFLKEWSGSLPHLQ